MKKKIVLLQLFIQCCLFGVIGQTWTGALSTDWNTAGNWNPAMVPTAVSNVIIPGSLNSSHWPVLAGNVTVNSINMQSGSQLNVNGFALTLKGNNSHDNYFVGATFNNTNGATDIVINVHTGSGGYATHFSGNIVNAPVIFNITGCNQFVEGDAEPANQYYRNATFNIKDLLPVYIAYTSRSHFNDNLTINRTVAGATCLFSAGAMVAGNFTYTNNTGGNTYLGNLSAKTEITGLVNITANYTTAGIFEMHRLINQSSGGIIQVQHSTGFNVSNDTLKLNFLSILKYTGASSARLFNNAITGNVTTVNEGECGEGNITYVHNNVITGNSSFTNTGSNKFYDGDFTGTGNVYQGDVTYINTSGNMSIAGGDFDQISQSLYLNAAAGIGLGNIKFNGNVNGVIEQLGTQPVSIANMVMEKVSSGTLSLNDPVSILSNARFTSGYIISNTANRLLFLDNATTTGASDASFVVGPVTKIGRQDFTFPTGINTDYAPISITAPLLVTDAFTAQYFNADINDADCDSSEHDATLDHISSREYWMLDRINGVATPKVTLSWKTCRSGIVNAMAALRVAHWKGTTWIDEGNGGITGTNEEGTIQSLGNINSFSPFTLASSNGNNPLPVNFVTFNANLRTDHSVLLHWNTSAEINNGHFDVERSADGRAWKYIATVLPQTSHVYEYADYLMTEGTYYYRIRQVDLGGNYSFSTIKVISIKTAGQLMIGPNPVSDQLNVYTSFSKGLMELTDVDGNIVRKMVINNTVTAVPVQQLASGVYYIRVRVNDVSYVSRFVKQ